MEFNLEKIVELVVGTINVPNAILVFIIFLSAWVLSTAQKSPTFEIGLMLTEDSGKPSSSRFAVLISLGITSYILAYAFVNKSVSESTLLSMFYAYIVTWASSKSVEKLIDAWAGKKNGYQQPPEDSTPDLKKIVETVSKSTETITKT